MKLYTCKIVVSGSHDSLFWTMLLIELYCIQSFSVSSVCQLHLISFFFHNLYDQELNSMYDQIKLYEPDQEFQELCMISYFMSGFYVISFRDEEFAIKLLKFLENLLSSSESVLRT
jgi:hypothetical protein